MRDYYFSGYFFVLLAATLWGTLGVFYKFLASSYELPSLEIVFWRALFASMFTFIFLGIWRRDELSFPRREIKLFFAMGVIGIAAFYIVYIIAIRLIGMGVASVLLYSAPLWVMLYGSIFQGEKIEQIEFLALILAIIGIILIGQVYDITQLRISSFGLLAGLGSGLGYAAYILLNKQISKHNYSTWTVNAYGLGIGALILLIFQDANELSKTLTNPSAMAWLIVLGMIPTLGGGLAFYAGLQRLSAVNASIVATFEPVVATTLGWIIFVERLNFLQALGGILVVGSVILIQLPLRRKNSFTDPQQLVDDEPS
ncbi:MAG: EamA family transporter [Chloroflexota bacterium]|nr:MAG: EamA family transporter [Chloroflexota bacterium]